MPTRNIYVYLGSSTEPITVRWGTGNGNDFSGLVRRLKAAKVGTHEESQVQVKIDQEWVIPEDDEEMPRGAFDVKVANSIPGEASLRHSLQSAAQNSVAAPVPAYFQGGRHGLLGAVPPSKADQAEVLVETALAYNSRPYTNVSTPIILLEPIFGQFLDNLKAIAIGAEDFKLVVSLGRVLCDFYLDEDTKKFQINQMLNMYLGQTVLPLTVPGTQAKVDGAVVNSFTDYEWAAMLSEVKLELGKGGQDPAFQCLCYFYDLAQKVWQKELVRGAPSLCLEFFGTYLRSSLG